MKTEENKKQVELTDEQLDNVAGGHQHKLAAGQRQFVNENDDPNFLKD